jgi:hypothetical protein
MSLRAIAPWISFFPSMNRRLTVALVAALCGRAGAGEVPLRELPTDKLLALAPSLRAGDMALIESQPDGHLAQVTVIALVAAPPDLVRRLVITPENYKDFGHSLSRSEVHRRPDGAIDYDFALDLGVVTLDNNHRMLLRPDGAIDVKDRGPRDATNYRWRVLPAPGGTLLVQYGFTDVRNASGYIRRLVTAAPQLEHGLALTTQVFFVRAVKERAERLAPPGSVPPMDPRLRGGSLGFLLERGRVAVMRSLPNGRLGDISIVDTIYASRARVEAVIQDPAAYHSFVDGVKKSEVIERRQPGELTYETEFDLSVFNWVTRFAQRRGSDGIDVMGLSGDQRGAHFRWDLTAQGEKETRAVFRANQDLSAASPLLLGMLFRREPLFEHGIAVALALLQEVGVRGRAEGWR